MHERREVFSLLLPAALVRAVTNAANDAGEKEMEFVVDALQRELRRRQGRIPETAWQQASRPGGAEVFTYRTPAGLRLRTEQAPKGPCFAFAETAAGGADMALVRIFDTLREAREALAAFAVTPWAAERIADRRPRKPADVARFVHDGRQYEIRFAEARHADSRTVTTDVRCDGYRVYFGPAAWVLSRLTEAAVLPWEADERVRKNVRRYLDALRAWEEAPLPGVGGSEPE